MRAPRKLRPRMDVWGLLENPRVHGLPGGSTRAYSCTLWVSILRFGVETPGMITRCSTVVKENRGHAFAVQRQSRQGGVEGCRSRNADAGGAGGWRQPCSSPSLGRVDQQARVAVLKRKVHALVHYLCPIGARKKAPGHARLCRHARSTDRGRGTAAHHGKRALGVGGLALLPAAHGLRSDPALPHQPPRHRHRYPLPTAAKQALGEEEGGKERKRKQTFLLLRLHIVNETEVKEARAPNISRSRREVWR